ncbi:MAG: hypothetical protein FOGNACKC_04969 [Anaerolineae bacterium]|nr:hypothetical protein [Anaerolineae bacterium]
MKKLLTTLLLAAILLSSLGLLALAQEPPPPPKGAEAIPASAPPPPIAVDRRLLPKIEPQLLKQLLQTDGAAVPFIAYMKAKANLSAATQPAGITTQGQSDPIARRQAVVSALQQTAQQSQAGVLQLLASSGVSAQASNVKSLWIVNAVAATGPLETVLALAIRDDVAIVRLDKTITLNFEPTEVSRQRSTLQLSTFNLQPSVEWGISKIRADMVHNALGINGAGVVVANIDTGVDWLHPDLKTRYRGYTGEGKLPNHAGNWFDATGQGAAYPIDGDGHGTHTMGTMVGQNGIGVAPGSRWIAVRAFDSSGTALNSWLHNAFQWVLAPNGNAALAPAVVNNSWSSNNGFSTEFQADVQALLAAGILPVFAAGNNGPGAGTVGSPGSLPESLAVGATDINDVIASFSSRGPSAWGEIKPEISAPGKNVRSTLPGGAYGSFSGTSMAAPHVAGLVALLLQADPTLAGNANRIEAVLKSTTLPLGSPSPNNDYGWGRVDAYSAVMAVAHAGTLAGVVSNSAGGAPVSNATVQLTPSLGGATIIATTGITGFYRQGLTPGSYNVAVSAFGYQPASVMYVSVTTATETTQNFSLTPKPTGILAGTITDKLSGQPLTATITVENTPVSASVSGGYRLELPIGVYTLTVVAAQHRISQAVNLSVLPGITTTRNFALDSAPSILLVDSGAWYQESQLAFYQQALADALYPADTWQIFQPFDSPNDIPSAATLAGYDMVIWSAPYDAPGYIGADDELKTYLDGGGRLLLSGQDVAYFDGGGFIFTADYLRNYLMTGYAQDTAGTDTVTGVPGEAFDGLTFTLSGGDGANNQTSPDVVTVVNPDSAGPLLTYQGDGAVAGVQVGLCRPYRAIFLPFGLEGVNSRTGRRQAIERSIDWLLTTPTGPGVELSPAEQTAVGNFGQTVTHTLRLRNTGSATDTIDLSLTPAGPYNWPASGLPASVTLGACTSKPLTITVQVPAAHTWHITDTLKVTAQSGLNVTVSDVATRNTKTPAPLLLVDDDRWYSFAAEFKAALQANGIGFDYWYVPKSWSGPTPPSPPLNTLQMYPLVVWYTAYDWFQPLTVTEEERLMAYLDGGGRLFFSSQDFLFRHLLNHSGSYGPFATDYLGVLTHTEDFSSTLALGNIDNPAGAYMGPFPLSFPAGYQNWTDALLPTDTAQIYTFGQHEQPNGLTHAGVGPGGQHWHTNFLAYGPELMSPADRTELLRRSLGWLSWLGSSTVEAAVGDLVNGATVVYTATLTNDGRENLPTAAFTATFPATLTPVGASPELSFDGSDYSWQGPLAVGASRVLTYAAQINQPVAVGQVISQTSWLGYPAHNIIFDRVTGLAATPNWRSSWLGVSPSQNVQPNDVLTYSLVLRNSGFTDAAAVTATNTLPAALDLLGIDPAPGTVTSSGNSITWTAAVARGESMTLTYRAAVSNTGGFIINNVAYVKDEFNPTVMLSASAVIKTTPIYLPVITKNSQQ